MNLTELQAEVARCRAIGAKFLILVVHRDRRPRGGRVRLLPGVVGDVEGHLPKSLGPRYHFGARVKVADLERYLHRVGSGES